MATTPQLTAQQLALYLGQKVETEIGIGTIDTISLHNTVLVLFEDDDEDNVCDFPCDEVKPILRRLDSITEEEARVLYSLRYPLESWDSESSCLNNWWLEKDEWYITESGFCVGIPAIWLYLLSLGIDLFGWIDAGLAIDKAMLQEK